MRLHRSGLFFGLALVLLAAAGALQALARTAVITRNDGSKVTGEVVSENAQAVTIRQSDNPIPIPIQRSEIKSIEYVKSIAEQYAEKRKALKDDDIDGRYALAQWLYDQKAYDLARKELTDLHQRAPKAERVSLLLKAVEARLKLLAPTEGPAEAPGETPTPPPETPAAGQLPTQKLSPEQVNMIKMYEVDPRRERPTVIVPNEAIDTLFSQYSSDPKVAALLEDHRAQSEFRNEPGWQQLDLFFEARARNLYPKLIIRSDPRPLKTFRTRIWPNYVRNSCATSACHGGPQAGRFFLFPDISNSDATVYTNFYILSKFSNPKNLTYMIDRANPDRSLLLQYGLPRQAAATPHPDVSGFRPAFSNDHDPRYTMVLNWIRKELAPTADYPINYQLPSTTHTAPASPVTQPKAPAPAKP